MQTNDSETRKYVLVFTGILILLAEGCQNDRGTQSVVIAEEEDRRLAEKNIQC